MAAVAFDTLKLAQRLEAAGFPPRQAQDTAAALAEAVTANIATAADLRETELRLHGEIREAELRLRAEIAGVRAEIAGVRTEMRTEIAGVRTEMRTEIAGVRAEIAGLRAELIKWAVGIGIAGVLAIGGMILSATLALLRVTPHP